MTNAVKICTSCRAEYPATTEHFAPQKLGAMGLTASCRICRRAKSKDWQKQNYERSVTNNRKWRQEHPELVKTAKKRHYEKHREKIITQVRNYRRDNPDACRRAPEKAKAKDAARQARKVGAPGSHTAQDIRLKLQEQGGLCYWCGAPIAERYQLDHIIPLSRGGSNDPDNICLACQSCNLKKGVKLPEEWHAPYPFNSR